jgi:hypothetical protein
MIRGGVGPDLIDYDLQVFLVRRFEKNPKILYRSEHRINIAIVGDIIPKIAHRAGEEGRQPYSVNAKLHDMIELLRDTSKIADAITVRVEEGARIDLIEDGAAPPVSVRMSRHGLPPDAPSQPDPFSRQRVNDARRRTGSSPCYQMTRARAGFDVAHET